MVYAELSHLESGWRILSKAEAERAEVLLARASVFLDSVVEKHHIDVNAKRSALQIVCCDLVQRKLEGTGGMPISSITETAGAFSETTSYFSRRKSWELYPEDLELLGVTKGKGRMVKVAIHDVEGNQIDW